MTTIAYNHRDREIAVDSRVSLDNMILTDESFKMIERSGVKFFTAGKSCDYDLMIDGYFGLDIKLIPECSMIAIDNGVVYLVSANNDAVICKAKMECNVTLGSGECFALAAMDFGKTAAEAVEYAKTRDPFTGGKVNVFSVDSPRS